MDDNGRAVPVRTILTTIGLVVLTLILLLVLYRSIRVLTWMLIAAFTAVALYPAVNRVQRRLKCPRSLATLAVFLPTLAAFIGIVAVFVIPLAHSSDDVVAGVQTMVNDARTGRGATGRMLDRVHASQWMAQHQAELQKAITRLGATAVGIVRGAAGWLFAGITILTLSFLMVLEGPRIVDTTMNLVRPDLRDRVRRVGGACAKVITGYIVGNVAISVICGCLTFAVLRLCGVPFAGLIALFVGIADLIPMVGATLGAIAAGLAGFLQSTGAGVAVVVFFIVYQQIENHALQPLIMSRTVKLNPLLVVITMLISVELAGLIGALLAVPIAGIGQVLVRDHWEHRRGGTPASRAVPG